MSTDIPMQDDADDVIDSVSFTRREYDTVLAALRTRQAIQGHVYNMPGQVDALEEIANEHGPALTMLEIDELIERINR